MLPKDVLQKQWTEKSVREAVAFFKRGKIPVGLSRYQKEHFENLLLQPGWKVMKDDRLFFQGLEIIPVERIEEILSEIYSTPELSAGSRDVLYNLVKEKYLGISRSMVMQFLKTRTSWQLHQPLRMYKRRTRSLLMKRPMIFWEADLIDLSKFSKVNNGFHWVLNVIDVFSKKVWSVPMKKKTGVESRKAFEKVFDKAGVPKILQTDNGGEFTAEEAEEVFEIYHIRHILSESHSPQQNGAVERVNKTLKSSLWRYFSLHDTKNWVNIYPSIVEAYNQRVHSSTGSRPDDLHSSRDPEVLDAALDKMIGKAKRIRGTVKTSGQKIQRGDFVRVSVFTNSQERKNAVFRKGFLPNWSSEIWEVSSVSRPKHNTEPIFTVKYRGQIKRLTRDRLQKISSETKSLYDERKELKDIKDKKYFDQYKNAQTLAKRGRKKKVLIPKTALSERAQNPRAKKKPRILDL